MGISSWLRGQERHRASRWSRLVQAESELVLAFVTGATGFLGSHVARVLAEQGAELRLLVRPTSDLRNLDGLNADRVIGDLRDSGFD
jgi:predicted amino acid dehydrogenase